MNLFELEKLSVALGYSILYTLWQGALVGGCLFIVLKLIPGKKANWRYISAYTSIVFMFLLFIGNIIVHFPDTPAHTLLSLDPSSNSIHYDSQQEVIPSTGVLSNLLNPVFDYTRKNNQLIFISWLLGVLFGYIRLSLGLTRINRFRKKYTFQPDAEWSKLLIDLAKKVGLSKLPKLSLSNKIHSPLTFGFFKPIVLFPASMLTSLSVDQIEMIMLHELAHIKRNDYLFNLFKTVMHNFLFFHPVVWWANALADEEREKSCDDIVVNTTEVPLKYIKSLLAIAEHPQDTWIPALYAVKKHHNFTSRITRIIKVKDMKRTDRIKSQYMAGILGFLLLFGILSVAFISKGQDTSMSKIQDANQPKQSPSETENVLRIETFGPSLSRFKWNWTDDKSMIITSKEETPAVIFNDRLLPSFENGEIPKELRNLKFSANEFIMHQLTKEEEMDLEKKWKNGLIKITFEPKDSITKANYDSLKTVKTKTYQSNGALVQVTELSSNENPMYIVDGREVENLEIEPHEIHSISVLGPEAVNVYGVKGKNGVVLITTKNGSLKLDSLPPHFTEEFKILLRQNFGQNSDQSKNSTPTPELPFLIDGKLGNITNLNPENIHSISVYNIDKSLEYGPIAKKGIIIVTTTGAINKTSIDEPIIYPNPIISESSIELNVMEPSPVIIEIYDQNGILKHTIVNEKLSSGKHSFTLSKSSLSSGTYIVKINSNGKIFNKRIVVE